MEPTDPTNEILEDIRGVARATREELHRMGEEVREELRQTSERLDRVERRQTESEIRLATEVAVVAGAVRELRDLLRDDRAFHARVEERRLSAVERRPG